MKNISIILLMLLSFSSKSQMLPTYDSLGNVTYYTEDTIKLPFSIAKKITRELVGCDSAKAILELTKDQLILTEQKVVLKDNIISNQMQKEVLYQQRISNEKEKFDIQGVYVKRLEWDNKKLRLKLTLWKTSFYLGVAGTVFAYFYFTK